MKNKKIAVFPIGEYLSMILKEYLEIRGGQPDDYLICTQTGKQFSGGGLRSSYESYVQIRGISKTSMHLLRHNFAVQYLLNGGDIGKLRELLTQSTLHMALHYAKNYCTDLQRDFNNTNPLEKMMSHDVNKKSKCIKVR